MGLLDTYRPKPAGRRFWAILHGRQGAPYGSWRASFLAELRSAPARCPRVRRCFSPSSTDSINAPNVCGDPPENHSVKQLWASIKGVIDSATGVNVEVDGNNANKLLQRVKSIVYEITLPDDNVFDEPCGGPGTVPAGIYSPSVDDGLYVLLKPLKPGQHKIYFHAISGGVLEDVTYTLMVEPVLLK